MQATARVFTGTAARARGNAQHSAARITALMLGLGLAASSPSAAAVEIYRCPGNPPVYTSDLRLVSANRCALLGAKPAAAVVPSAAAVRPVVATKPLRESATSATVSSAVQQQRDSDRVQILQTEQARERERLAQLTQQLRARQASSPEASDPKQTETLALSQAIQRAETDLQALDKELARALR